MPNIGIDFGTTNSVIVAYNKKKNEFTYFNFARGRGGAPIPTSSTVWYHDNIVEVGKNARDNINKYGDVEGHHFERSIKLKLGSGQNLNIFGASVKPYVVAGTILNHLKQTAINDWHADKAGVDLSRAVFSVPINFNGEARRDLRKSANEAGIDVTTFIHEPFAAIVGHFFTKYQAEKSEDIVQKLKTLKPVAPRASKAPRAASAAAKTAAGRSAQARARQLAVGQARQAAKATASLSRKAVTGAVKAAAAMVSALAGLLGGAAILLPLCIVVLAAAVIASPFGIFLAGQEPEPGTVSPNGAIAQVNIELTDYLAELQTGDYADIQLQGQLPEWREVLAVFAIRTTFSEDGVDVVTLDPDRVERLKDVFWDMVTITTETDETDAGTVLYLTVEARTADDMRELYGFTDDQNAALDELLAETELLDGLITDLSVSQADAAVLVDALPEDLDPARRAVVETACSLVGKVNYFWGGKSLVLGWDSRWGSLRKVTAEGSPTSGTYRPYGLDCSGMVDWVFYNATGGEYVIGHGGGAAAQHSYCTPILWSEAQPGDLVFYPEDVHVGIVGGRDEDGRLLIIHCASGYNNTVITGLEGFTAIARPQYDTAKATRS